MAMAITVDSWLFGLDGGKGVRSEFQLGLVKRQLQSLKRGTSAPSGLAQRCRDCQRKAELLRRRDRGKGDIPATKWVGVPCGNLRIGYE